MIDVHTFVVHESNLFKQNSFFYWNFFIIIEWLIVFKLCQNQCTSINIKIAATNKSNGGIEEFSEKKQ
jgi:hypothetical protein